jgi:ABC-type multidrug transport system ATPase subunit
MTSILSLADVSKRFHAGTPSEVSALRKLHFTVEAGDFVTIIGSNGAGKSTLLKVIAGMVIPDTGTVTFEGRNITRWPVYRRAAVIGRIAQDPGDSTCPPRRRLRKALAVRSGAGGPESAPRHHAGRARALRRWPDWPRLESVSSPASARFRAASARPWHC